MRVSSDSSSATMEERREVLVGDLAQTVCVVADDGRFCRDVTELLRAHAIVRLFEHSDPKGFANDLIMSARARRAYLHHQRRSAGTPRSPVRHCSGAFFDALAAGDLDLAADLARLAPALCRTNGAREDDFLWHRTLGLLTAGASAPAIDAHLSRLAKCVAHEGDARLAVCRALHAADTPAFARAFRCLLLRRESELAEARARASTHPYAALDEELYVEGVAVLKLARARGIAIAREYPMCPAVAIAEPAAA
jgi:hypothetical protein